ncbi:MAG: ABC transporter permease [Bacteroidia bacterium]|nr:ABC transporter permease [Bacteroidia bacterium]
MNLELFIAKRITLNSSKSFSNLIVKIAISAVALSIAVMICSIAIVNGFQSEIRDKVVGFGSHIQISNFDHNNSFESSPINWDDELISKLSAHPDIKHIESYATKAGIIKTDNEIEGVLLKGIGKDFDFDFFKQNMVDGKLINLSGPSKSKDIMVSTTIASKLNLKTGDKLLMYFIQDPPRIRPFTVSGIYETGFEDFDKLFVFADIAHIQKLNSWEDNQIGGYEILINQYERIEEVGDFVYASIGHTLDSRTIKEIYPQIFDWLTLQDTNVIIIISLMAIVSIINMITALLILILERTNMIGTLKSLGANNWSIRKIFIYNAMYLIGKGLLWGNLIGVGFCILQKQFGIFTLPQESYYLSVVPINLNLTYLLLLNLSTIIICSLMMVIPSYLVSRITPIKAIRFN